MDSMGNYQVASAYSHPEAPVRHSYPLAIRNSDFSTAISLVMRTLPYAGARFAVLFGATLATVLFWVIAFGGWVFLARNVHDTVGLIWFIGCIVAYGTAWRGVVRYFLYLLKAGQIAVLTELITRDQVGDGHEHMFAYGKRIVTERFGQMNIMFGIDLLVSGVITAFNRTLNWITSLLPIPGLGDIQSLMNRIVRGATTYVDETILSYSLARGDEDVARASVDGLIYYAQNAKEVLKTGVFIVVVDKITSVLTFLVMIIPAIAIGAILPDSVKAGGILFTAALSWMLAWAVRGAFLEPLFLTMVMIKYHVCIQNQPIHQEWDDQLSRVSDKFVQLKNQIGQQLGRPARSAA